MKTAQKEKFLTQAKELRDLIKEGRGHLAANKLVDYIPRFPTVETRRLGVCILRHLHWDGTDSLALNLAQELVDELFYTEAS